MSGHFVFLLVVVFFTGAPLWHSQLQTLYTNVLVWQVSQSLTRHQPEGAFATLTGVWSSIFLRTGLGGDASDLYAGVGSLEGSQGAVD